MLRNAVIRLRGFLFLFLFFEDMRVYIDIDILLSNRKQMILL